MSKTLTAIALTIGLSVSTVAQAGNPEPAPVEPPVAVEPAPNNSHGILVPILAAIFIIAGLADD